MKKVGIALLVFGIILFGIGVATDSGQEVKSYHKIWKDSSGTWQGTDVSYLADKVNAGMVIGLIAGVAGGIMIAAERKNRQFCFRKGAHMKHEEFGEESIRQGKGNSYYGRTV